jgi:hypothetical protein
MPLRRQKRFNRYSLRPCPRGRLNDVAFLDDTTPDRNFEADPDRRPVNPAK